MFFVVLDKLLEVDLPINNSWNNPDQKIFLRKVYYAKAAICNKPTILKHLFSMVFSVALLIIEIDG